MTDLRPDEALAGIVAAAATVWIVWILRRALRDRRLPIGKSQVCRAERPSAFHILFAFYIAAALLMAFISLDLLFGIGARIW